MKQLLSKIFIASFFVLAFVSFSPKADALVANLTLVDAADTGLEDSGGVSGSGSSSTGSTSTTNTSPLYLNVNGIQNAYKKGDSMPFTISAYYTACSNVNLSITGNARIAGFTSGFYVDNFSGQVVGGQSLYESAVLKAPNEAGASSVIINLTVNRIEYAVVRYNIAGRNIHLADFTNYQGAYDYMLMMSSSGVPENDGDYDIPFDIGGDDVLASSGSFAVIKANQYLTSKEIIIPFTVEDAEPISVEISATDENGQNTASAGETLTIKKGETALIEWMVSNDIPDYCRLKSLSTSAMTTLKETANSKSGEYYTERLEEDTRYYVTCGKQDQ